jgi:imidazolonepropionase-like amidohydrolase
MAREHIQSPRMVAIALAAELWIAGGRVAGRPADVHVRDGRIVDLSAALAAKAPRGAHVIDARGLWLVPAVIDAHVHLAVAGALPAVAAQELRSGVAAVLDLGAPERLLPSLRALPLTTVFSGPLLTAPRGYPTQSWGADGYGLEVATPELAQAGARFIKLAFDARFPLLTPEVARAAADEAHRLGLRVAAHALDEASVRRALDASADVFAHTPQGALPDELLSRIKIVVSTLHAFGGPVANLRALHRLGARIVYGTDLGNTGTAPGIDERELRLLAEAGLSPAEIVEAATRAGADLLGLPDLGRLQVGARASLLALREDPLADASALARPAFVLIDGVRQE